MLRFSGRTVSEPATRCSTFDTGRRLVEFAAYHERGNPGVTLLAAACFVFSRIQRVRAFGSITATRHGMNAPLILTTTTQLTGAPGNRTRILRRMGDFWCTLMHNSIMWPIHGHYQCRRCGRLRPVPWAQANDFSYYRLKWTTRLGDRAVKSRTGRPIAEIATGSLR